MPRLFITAIYSIGAAALLIQSYYSTDPLTQSLLFVVGVIFAIMALSSYWHWVGYAHAINLRDVNEARATTEKTRMAEYIAKMAPDQIRALTLFVPSILVTAGDAGPIYNLDLDSGRVPMTFVKEFIERGNRAYLCPISEYSDGTDEREWAKAITAYLITLRFCNPAIGNRSAKWVDFSGAMHSLGIEEDTTQ